MHIDKSEMLWILLTPVTLALLVLQVEAQYGYMMPQPMMMAPQPMMMAPQPMMGMGYGGGIQQPGMMGGGGGGVQKGPWSECSRTCGIDSVRTRTYTPCDTSRSSCTEKEGCMVPECGLTKLFKEGEEVKVPCHSEAGKPNYKAQWFKYEDNDKNWKYVSMIPNQKFMDEKMNLVIAKVSVIDQGTYRCNLQSMEGTIVAESIWHFSVEALVNKEAAGGGSAAVVVVIIIIVIIVCVCCRKKGGEGDESKAKAASGGETGGYDFGGGDDFDFGY